jgi:hypothetical protein
MAPKGPADGTYEVETEVAIVREASLLAESVLSLLTNHLSLLTLRSGFQYEIEIGEAALLRISNVQ